MRLRYCILLSLLLITTSILWLSCDKEDTVYSYSPDLDIRFVPINPYGHLYPTNDGCLVAYVQDKKYQYNLVKIHSDGKVDSTSYSFVGDDRGGSSGTIFLNKNGDVFIYGTDYINEKSKIIHFDSDINVVGETSIFFDPKCDVEYDSEYDVENNDEIIEYYFKYDIECNCPIPLINGGFVFVVNRKLIRKRTNKEQPENSYEEPLNAERFFYTIDQQGNQQNAMPLYFADEFVYNVSQLYFYNDTYVVQYDNAMSEVSFAFYDLNGTRKGTVSIPGFSMVTSYFFDNFLYVLVHTFGSSASECYSLYKYGLDGTLHTTSHPMKISLAEEINEIGDRLYVSGYINIPSQKQGVPGAFVGKIFSIDKETLTDIDTVVMSYNSIPLSVFPDGNDGYNVFLTRKFNYDNTQFMNLEFDNVYIYNVDDLHKLQIDE